jgi:hypothetical protein
MPIEGEGQAGERYYKGYASSRLPFLIFAKGKGEKGSFNDVIGLGRLVSRHFSSFLPLFLFPRHKLLLQ